MIFNWKCRIVACALFHGNGVRIQRAIFLQRILNLIGNVRNRAVPLYMKGNLLYFFNAWFLYLDLIRCYIEIGDDLRFR